MHKYLNPFTGIFGKYLSNFWNIQYKALLFLLPISWLVTYYYTGMLQYAEVFVWAYTIALINSYIYFEKTGQ